MLGSQHRFRKAEETVAFLSNGSEAQYNEDVETKFTKSATYRQRHPEYPWMISTCVLAVLLIISHLSRAPVRHAGHGRCDVHPSDFLPLQGAIEYEQRPYGGEVWFNSTSGLAERLPTLEGEAVYFGPPSRQLDNTWKAALRDTFPILYDNEVAEASINGTGLEEINRWPDGHFHFVPDVFHTLHCLNTIRKVASKSLYSEEQIIDHDLLLEEEDRHKLELENFGPDYHRIHTEHCMDRIRQALICHGDLTPSIQYRFDGLYGALGRTGPRTCRKLGPIRAWLDERAERDRETKMKDAANVIV